MLKAGDVAAAKRKREASGGQGQPKYCTIKARTDEHRVIVKTSEGRERLVRIDDPCLRRATVIEELFCRNSFPRLWWQHAV